MPVVGVDIINVDRIRHELERDDGSFIRQLFTDCEINHIKGLLHYPAKLAAMFACKEAVFKSLGTGSPDTGGFREVEVFIEKNSTAQIVLHNRTKITATQKGYDNFHAAISFTNDWALAVVIAENN